MRTVVGALGAVFLLALVNTPALPTHAGVDEEPAVVIQVGDVTLDGQGGRGRSLVLLRTAPGVYVQEFEITLDFDPGVVLPVDTNPGVSGVQVAVDRFWAEDSETAVDRAAGQIRVAGTSESECTAGECVFFTVGWDGVSRGESEIAISEFTLSGSGVDSSAIGVIDGTVTVAELPDIESAGVVTGNSTGRRWVISMSSAGRIPSGVATLALLGVAAVLVVLAKLLAGQLRGSAQRTTEAAGLSPSEETAVSDFFDRLESGAPRTPDGPRP